MKNVYIIDEYQSSQKNGLGVFVKELIKGLKSFDINICHLDVNAEKEEFTIESTDDVKRYCFPKLPSYPFMSSLEILNVFLRLYVEDSSDNVFILNHSPCEKLILAIRESHPLSKVIFVIHDFGWTMSLGGNYLKMEEIISNKEEVNIKLDFPFDYFEEEKLMYSLVDKVICLSQDTYSMLQKSYGVDKSKITLISNGLEDTYTNTNEKEKNFLKRERYIKEENILIYVGRINKIKGGTALLASFSEILKENQDCRLVIIGYIFDPSEVLKLGKEISSKITYTGHISKAEIMEWYQIADIGLIPSYIEQCSYVGIEMMMHGLPIVASDGFGIRCMFEDGMNAKVAKIEDYEDDKLYVENLAKSILKVLESESLQQTLRRGARNAYERIHSAENMSFAYKTLFENL